MQEMRQFNRIGVGAILTEAARLYRERFRAFMTPVLAIQLPLYAMLYGVLAGFIALSVNLRFSFAAGLGLILYLVYFLIMIATVLLGAPAMFAQYAAILYPASSGMRSLRYAFSRYGRSLGVMLATYGIVLAGTLAMYIPFVGSMVSGAFLASSISSGLFSRFEPSLIVIVVIAVLGFLLVMASALVTAAASGMTAPAAVKLDFTVGKAVKYSLRNIGPALAGGALANGLYMLCVLVVNVLLAGGLVFLRSYSGITGEMMVAAAVTWLVILLAIAVFGVPFQIAMNCAVFNLTRPKE